MAHPTPGGASLRIAPALPSSTPGPNATSTGTFCGTVLPRVATASPNSRLQWWMRARRHARRLPQRSNGQLQYKAAWQRYLEAAARLEPDYLPQMRRLLRDIDRFERLLSLPIAAEPAA